MYGLLLLMEAVLSVHLTLANSSMDTVTLQPNLNPGSLLTLKFVALVSRHGSRSPLSTFPNDPYPYTDRTFWPNGPAELTNLGKVQLYHTGQYVKMRYHGFLGLSYNTEESEVTYNPYNRDYMSAACLTAGMYPPVEAQIWNGVLPWQPVIQSQRDFDVCDLSTTNACPRFKQLFNTQMAKFNENTDKYKELIKYISDSTGMNISHLSQISDIYDTLLMQEQNGYKLPLWTKEVFPKTLRGIATENMVQTFAGNNELLRLGAGPELKYISDLLTKATNGSVNNVKKFYIEAAHDCTLIALLRALGNNDTHLEIKTGAFLIFELHYLEPDYIVQCLYFTTSYDANPEIITITSCPHPCSLSNFNKFVDSINPSDWKKSCQT